MDREKTILRVTTWGAVGNLILSAMKLVAGIAGQSSAMMADAIHSMSDMVSDAVVLVMVKVSSKGVDKNHDYGHGKFETLATAIIAILLLVVGIKMMTDGIGTIQSIIDGERVATPSRLALGAALLSILTKEILYQWTARVGKKVNSPAMITNAWHHRTDALSSIGSALGIGGAILLGGHWVILDPLVGCLISIFIIVIAIRMAMPALHELTEGSLPEEIENDVTKIIESVDGVENVHALKSRRNGPKIILSAHIVVDPTITVAEAHYITVKAENAVKAKYGNETLIMIHIEPDEDAE